MDFDEGFDGERGKVERTSRNDEFCFSVEKKRSPVVGMDGSAAAAFGDCPGG
jgi:hypothetical protein